MPWLISVCLLLALAQVLLVPCKAYNKDNVLVDYGDLLKISKSTEPTEVVEKMELYSFPYIANVSQREVLVLQSSDLFSVLTHIQLS